MKYSIEEPPTKWKISGDTGYWPRIDKCVHTLRVTQVGVVGKYVTMDDSPEGIIGALRAMADALESEFIGPPDLRKQVQQSTKEKMNWVLQHQEELLTAFVAKTGLQPDECELVTEMRADGVEAHWARRKPQ